ncbi:MAG: DUF502 domain-containing protein [Deltaproteobacteria bacterium]|nr:DUF502 domain-containing protein [Deltaproteobacteria bacterium]
MKKGLRAYFIAGLLVVVPLYITVYVLSLIVSFMDGVFLLMPSSFHPDNFLPVHVPGLGIIVTLVLVLLVGVIATNFFGKRLLGIGEKVLLKIPVLRIVYNATKQFMETFFTKEHQGFRRVVLIEFPRAGLYSIGFVTSRPSGEIKEKVGDEMISVFIPTTPNPTTGFFILVSEKDVITLSMRVEDAFKIIMTGGMVFPNNEEFKAPMRENAAKAGANTAL